MKCLMCLNDVAEGQVKRKRIYCSETCRLKKARQKCSLKFKERTGMTRFQEAVSKGLCGYCFIRPILERKSCDKCRAIIQKSNEETRLRRRQEVLKAYGSKCVCCNESCLEF